MANLKSVDSAAFSSAVLENSKVVVIDFWAEWCGPCKAITPKLVKLQAEFDGVIEVMKCDVDSNPDIAAQYMVTSIPTILFFKGGSPADSLVGNRPYDALVKKVQGLL